MRHLLGVLLVVVICAWPLSDAFAFRITLTCGDWPEDVVCGDGDVSLPTYWEKPCISFYLNEQGTKQMKFVDVMDVVKQSIVAWNHPEKSSLTLNYAGLTNEDRVGFNPYINDNANIIVFRDGDSWEESSMMMALTTVTHSRSTGVIYDADIEVNTSSFKYGIFEKDGVGVVDLQNTLTPEIGHAFGLAHSDVLDATMFPYSSTGDISLRTLDEDDLAAIENLYPPSNSQCKFGAEDYFVRPKYAMNEGPAQNTEDCSGIPMGRQAPLGWGLLLLGVLCILKKRRGLRKQ